MSKKMQVSIHEPCHENWEKMDPVEKGRFCGSCQKQVVDFTGMSDRQVAEFFKKPSTGSVCGRFMTDQLDREIEIPRKRIPWLKYLFTIAIPAFFITKSNAQKMGKVAVPYTQRDTTTRPSNDVIGKISPVPLPVCTTDTSSNPLVKGEISYIPRQVEILVKGKVVNENGKPLAGAVIIVKNTNNGVAADRFGRFTIKVNKGDILNVSNEGYINFVTTVGDDRKMEIVMSKVKEVIMVAGMISIDRREMPAKDTVINFPIVLENDYEDIPLIANVENNNSLINTFPNPVTAGQSLRIECKKMGPGDYTLEWIDQSGRQVSREQLTITNKQSLTQVFAPAVTKGSYFMVLTERKSGKRYAQKIIIR